MVCGKLCRKTQYIIYLLFLLLYFNDFLIKMFNLKRFFLLASKIRETNDMGKCLITVIISTTYIVMVVAYSDLQLHSRHNDLAFLKVPTNVY